MDLIQNTIPSAAKVFAVVVSFNGAQWVDRCFGSLRNSIFPITTILVDNRSTDRTLALVRSTFPDVQIISNPENEGFGKANNQGIIKALAAGADYIFLLNQDAWIEPGTVGHLVDACIQNQGYGVISPMHFTGAGDKLDHNFEFYLSKDYATEMIYHWIAERPVAVHPSQFINAAAWMVSRKCFERVGGFGYLFFHYGEDYDFIHRLNFFDLKLGFTGGARIFHDRENRKRELFFNDGQSLVKYFYIGSLVRMTTPERSFFSSLLHVCFWNIKELGVLFLKGKWRAPAVFLQVLFTIVRNAREISSYRKLISAGNKFLFLGKLDAQ
jgi:N-acetylglucosaminyl-diphospho-decaprenol L-rhamnosyltransferase